MTYTLTHRLTHTMTSDRIIDLADRLGLGVDLDFTGRRPVLIKDGRSTKRFVTMDECLSYLKKRAERLVD